MEEVIFWLYNNRKWLFSGAGVFLVSAIGYFLCKRKQVLSTQTIRSKGDSINIQAGRDVNIGPTEEKNDTKER